MPRFLAASSSGEGAAEAPAGRESTLIVDETRREASWRSQRLDLSPTEFALLAHLVHRAGQTVTYEALLQEVWRAPLGQGGSLSQVRSTVKRLRQKLVAVSGGSCQLVSVRSVGYRLELATVDRRLPRSRRPLALKVSLILVVAALLVVLVAGWSFLRHSRGDPTVRVWYRQQRVPVGVLWALGRGRHCVEGPDGALYCFDTPEERAAAIDVLLRNAAPQGQEPPRAPGATTVPQPQGE